MLTHPTTIDLPDGGTVSGLVTNGRRLEMLAGAFLAGYKVRTTRDAYRIDLRFWFDWCAQRGLDPLDVHRSVLETFMRKMEDEGRMPSTVARRASTINTFYEYLVDEEVIDKNPVRKARKPKVPAESTREHLNVYELVRWLKEAELEGGYPNALAHLLAMNALRISEACNANVEDMGTDGYHVTLRIVGKGDKPALIALNPPTIRAIEAAVGNRRTGPLLLNSVGSRMDREAAARIVRRLCRRADIHKNIVNHSLRHSAITALLNSGANTRDVQQFARHADPRTTYRYDRDKDNLDRHGSYGMMQVIGSAR